MEHHRGKVEGIATIISCSYWFYANDLKWCMAPDPAVSLRMAGGDLRFGSHKGPDQFEQI